MHNQTSLRSESGSSALSTHARASKPIDILIRFRLQWADTTPARQRKIDTDCNHIGASMQNASRRAKHVDNQTNNQHVAIKNKLALAIAGCNNGSSSREEYYVLNIHMLYDVHSIYYSSTYVFGYSGTCDFHL